MFVKMWGAEIVGIEGTLIEVEVNLSPGLPMVSVVGLPDSAVRESVERVRAAILNAGMTFPLERITVNLAPADVRKEGTAFDLAIAAGILCASGQWNADAFRGTLLIGELSLNGEIRPVPGVLPMVEAARAAGLTKVVVPRACAAEATLVDGVQVFALDSLAAWGESGPQIFRSGGEAAAVRPDADPLMDVADLADVRGQHHGKRALIVAAAGMHNILFTGPPGTGKTMLCRRLSALMPPLDDEEALTVTKIYSASGKLNVPRAGLIRSRPFRAPHHTISAAGLIGGGPVPKPGEVTLAHHGVLFLDELPEFPRTVLETLRQPLEDRTVTIGRARTVCRFPAHFLLAATMNPCPCGNYGGRYPPGQACSCPEGAIIRYRSRVSGPFLDRIDLQVELPQQRDGPSGEGEDRSRRMTSAEARKLVAEAYEIQRERYKGTGIRWNSELQGRMLERYAVLAPEAKRLLLDIYTRLGLSHRAHDRLLKVSRTIADLAGSERIEAEHVAEAAQYRCLDRPPAAAG